MSLVFVDLINVLLPLVVKVSIDAVPRGKTQLLLWAGIAYVILMTIQALGRYLWRIYLIGTSHYIAQELRVKLYGHLQKLPLAYYQRVRTGDLMSRATNDVEAIRMAMGPGILVAIDAALMVIFIVPAMFYLSLKMTLLAFAFYPLVPWITLKLGNKIDVLFENLQVRMSTMGAYAQESFAAVRLIKSLVLENRTAERFFSLSKGYEAEAISLSKYQAVFSPCLSIITNFGTLLILFFGGWDVVNGLITVGTFVAFQRFVTQLSWPMEAIGWAVSLSREGAAAERRLRQILNEPEVKSCRTESLGGGNFGALLEIKHLTFTHPSDTESEFNLNVSDLRILRGQKIGLVGPVGSGKSTLFNNILRLYEPPENSIFLENVDVVSIPLSDLRQKIASVEQQVFLFSENLETNIKLGAAGEVLTSDIERISAVAGIRQEIEDLEFGFNTRLGERGVNLSGGQKQRLALTRALVRQPTLLLLDDCFSAVDVDIENRIIENFFSTYPTLSVCFASHRLSVMARMDEVWVIDNGEIIARGKHERLLNECALYRDLWVKSERQLELEKLDPLFRDSSVEAGVSR